MPDKLEFDWSSAEVTDGTLVVALSGKTRKKWREAFERATALLSHGSWHARLSQKNRAVKVEPVRPGEEERVRQFLEGAVLEANRTIVAEEELFDDSPSDSEGEDPQPSRDDEMTQRFRSFAPGSSASNAAGASFS
jgi:hypothetical protein